MNGPRYQWQSLHGRYRNWLSQRAHDRGKVPLPDRVTRTIGASLPVVRDRINPATGRPRRDDIELTRSQGRSLAAWRDRRSGRGGGREFR